MVKRILFASFVLSVSVAYPNGGLPDPLTIVRRAIDTSNRSDYQMGDYHATQDTYKRELDQGGKITSTKRETFDVFTLFGEPYNRLVARDGKELTSDEKRKVEQKYRDTHRERESESPEGRRKRLAEYHEKVMKRREMLAEVPDAYHFSHIREEEIDGMPTWVLHAQPKPEYRPKSFRTSFLSKMEGRFWIAKEHYRLVKMEAVTTGPVSFGWFLAKLGKGSTIDFEQMRLDNDLWVTKRFKLTYDMRIALVKHLRAETEQVMSNWRKPNVTSVSASRHR